MGKFDVIAYTDLSKEICDGSIKCNSISDVAIWISHNRKRKFIQRVDLLSNHRKSWYFVHIK